MTAQPIAQASARPDPDRTPAAVRSLLARHADEATLAVFDRALDTAYLEALTSGSPEPMRSVVSNWGTIADAAQNGLPAGRQRVRAGTQGFRRSWEEHNGRPLPTTD